MYKLHLILKYLRKRRIAWVSLIAVMLCTTMVMVVISVMGGWLEMFENSFHGLSGDVLVESNSLSGFPYYQEIIDQVVKKPGIEAAVPSITTFGLVNIGNIVNNGVQVMGFPIEEIGKVNRFPDSLYKQYGQYVDAAKKPGLTREQREEFLRQAEEHRQHPSFKLPLSADEYRHLLPNAKTDASTFPGLIGGAGVLGIHRDATGEIVGRDEDLYRIPVKLTVLGIDDNFSVDEKRKSERIYWIVDDSRTSMWQYDNRFVYVPFEQLQRDLHMDASTATDVDSGKEVTIPGRATEIHIKVKDGYDLNAAKGVVQQVVHDVLRQRRAEAIVSWMDPKVQTWRESQALWINAIENEKLLTVFLFSLISVVAIFLIFCIFYMIVVEKTRDIGIIKSVGATSTGVAGIFLGYGLTIGIVGSMLGFTASYFLVRYINELHHWLGTQFGVRIWDPQVYLFDKIPNTMNPHEVMVILSIAILASVLGALVPAMRAARMNPVESLRWE